MAFKETWAYAEKMKEMFPGYRATNLPVMNGRSWPRDIVCTEMPALVVNINPDLTQFPMLQGTTTQ